VREKGGDEGGRDGCCHGTIELRPCRSHPFRHRRLGQALCFHALVELDLAKAVCGERAAVSGSDE
jgi:hypothetical protein